MGITRYCKEVNLKKIREMKFGLSVLYDGYKRSEGMPKDYMREIWRKSVEEYLENFMFFYGVFNPEKELFLRHPLDDAFNFGKKAGEILDFEADRKTLRRTFDNFVVPF